MEAYTDPTRKCNDAEPVQVALMRWTLAERLRLSQKQCTAPGRHRGRARRHRREIDTRKGLETRAAILSGALTFTGADGAEHTWRELVHARIDGRAPALYELRVLARRLMDQVTAWGPVRGWGVPQPMRSGPGVEKWTPYYVPKKQEPCWRQWRRVRIELMRVLLLLARWWGLLIPPHRAPRDRRDAPESRSTTPASLPQNGTRCRDQSGGWETALARLVARAQAM